MKDIKTSLILENGTTTVIDQGIFFTKKDSKNLFELFQDEDPYKIYFTQTDKEGLDGLEHVAIDGGVEITSSGHGFMNTPYAFASYPNGDTLGMWLRVEKLSTDIYQIYYNIVRHNG
ncbi:MAG: hypothetical protein WCO30_02700 [bacterium]